MKTYKYFLATLLVILADQLIKLYVFYNFPFEGYEVKIFGDWFKLNYITNEGMAFGLSLGGATGKLILSIFRILAVGFLFYLLYKMIISKDRLALIISFSLILAGAIGNIIDSAF